jgi:SAM-dependent methyltransferase
MSGLVLRADDGHLLPLEPARWHQPPTAWEHAQLARLAGPVLDVGCGPGRVLEGLARRGLAALGVDPAPGAVELARRRGCCVLQRSVFDRLPGEGRWATVLLLDGNIGIGGDPVALLRRCRTLVRPNGLVLAEVEPPGAGWRRYRARLERDDQRSAWFPWSIVGADAVEELAYAAGLGVTQVQPSGEGRWFVELSPERSRARASA